MSDDADKLEVALSEGIDWTVTVEEAKVLRDEKAVCVRVPVASAVVDTQLVSVAVPLGDANVDDDAEKQLLDDGMAVDEGERE